MSKVRGSRPATPAKNSEPSTEEAPARERTVQSSVSLRPSQWKRLDVLGDLTQWGRSGALAQAVDLLTTLPVSVTQRLATLNRTTARATLQDRLRAAVEEAIEAAEAELPDDPWAEFDAALVSVGDAFEKSAASSLSERELIAAAEAAKRDYRRERHARAAGGTSSR